MLTEKHKTSGLSPCKHSKKCSSVFADCKWIWQGETEHQENLWVNIRKSFIIDTIDKNARFYISIDTDYCLWINGNFAGTGQLTNFPRYKTYDCLDISQHLKTGKNYLCILGYYQGRSTNRYSKGTPGIIFSLHNHQVRIISDNSCKTRTSKSYINGPVPVVTKQLGFTICYNAHNEDNWLNADYDDSVWSNSAELAGATDGYWTRLTPRPMPKHILDKITVKKLISGGTLKRNTSEKTAAIATSSDTLYPTAVYQLNTKVKDLHINPVAEDFSGAYIIADMGYEERGYLEFEITAQKGTIIDIAHGEHLFDGKVRCLIEDRNFADQYICKEGHQIWQMPIRRIACRYLELHITNFNRQITIHHLGMMRESYPINKKGSFECSSDSHNSIHKICIRTLELCMGSYYEDSPWREQALYALDAKNQALFGYYAFGEYDYAEESLRFLGKSIRNDGFLSLCAPTDRKLTVPSFSMVWITSIWEHMLYSGKRILVDEFINQIEVMLQKYKLMCNGQGLLVCPTQKHFWNFYEWSDGLDGLPYTAPTDSSSGCRIDSCLNMLYLDALNACVNIMEFINHKSVSAIRSDAAKLKEAISKIILSNKTFFVPNHFYPSEDNQKYSQFTQALALCLNVENQQFSHKLGYSLLNDKTLVPATISSFLYLYRVILRGDEGYSEFVVEHIAEIWGNMLKQDSTTCWETAKGADDFYGAGSLCHGWSAVPVYIYYAYVLGIKPIKPGFEKFSVSPLLECMEYADGKVPTPYGEIYVKWQKNLKQLTIKHPAGAEPEVKIKNADWNIDIKKYFSEQVG